MLEDIALLFRLIFCRYGGATRQGLTMGRLYLIAGMLVMLSPVLLASFFADLTRKQAVILGILLLSAVGTVVFYNTETFDDLVWHWRRPPMPSDESLFVSTATQIRKDAAQYQDGPHLEALLAALCRTPTRATGWTGRILNSFDSSSKRGKVVLLKVSPHITIRTSFSDDPSNTLISGGTALYKGVSDLSSGDPVQFSGEFATAFGSCGGVQNLADALQDPNFIFLFSDIHRYKNP
jgi:hypothetical protein